MLNRPESPSHLFLAFTRLALQGFGGVLAVAQRELVERLNWMSKEEFVETLAIAPSAMLCVTFVSSSAVRVLYSSDTPLAKQRAVSFLE